MKEYSIYLLVGLALIFSSCEDKDMQASSPTFDVNVDKLEYAPGEEVKFNIAVMLSTYPSIRERCIMIMHVGMVVWLNMKV